MIADTVELLISYRKIAEQKEEEQLFSEAAFSREHSRLEHENSDHRMPYKRDADRILHSKAFARYSDKTQVVYLVENDHIAHRSLHVQLVSSFARGIAEILRLNLDLVEAIALGHDVGHPPFGHEGEGYLSELALGHGGSSFAHPIQSCRLFSLVEPLNLGLAVYDGFLCHDGGLGENVLHPKFGKKWKNHFEEQQLKINHPDMNIMPGSLEGCLVKLCDTISYTGRDIEDAISLAILDRKDIPETCLGNSNREILSRLAMDIIHHSYLKPYISLSHTSYEALKILRKFNFERIYNHPKLKVESSKIKRGYKILFSWFLEEWNAAGEKSYLWRHYVSKRPAEYREKTSAVQMVVDYISGMTDSFFIRTLEKILIPHEILIERSVL